MSKKQPRKAAPTKAAKRAAKSGKKKPRRHKVTQNPPTVDGSLFPVVLKESEEQHRYKEWDRNHVLIKEAYLTLMVDLLRFPTQTEVAVKCDLSRETVNRHLSEMTFEPIKHPARILTDEVIKSIAQASFKGNSASQKLWLQVMEGWVEKTEQEIKNDLPPVTGVQLEIIPPKAQP